MGGGTMVAHGTAVREPVTRGVPDMSIQLDDETADVSRLPGKHRAAAMSLANGGLERMAERHDAGAFLTLDSDFGIYRKNGRRIIPTISPA